MNRAIKSLNLLAVIILITAILGCGSDGPSSDATIFTEQDLIDNPAQMIDPNKDTVIIDVETPDCPERPDKDEVGVDVIQYIYVEPTSQKICWEDGNEGAEHTLTVHDIEGSEVMRVVANGECVTEVLEAGEYEYRVSHDNKSTDECFILFIVANEDIEEQAGLPQKEQSLVEALIGLVNKINIVEKLFAQDATATANKQKLLTTNPPSCIGCELKKVDLSFKDLQNADLTGADLTRSDLSNSNFTGAEFTSANLTRADLSNSIFIRADFTLTDLVKAIFTGANFSGAIWIDGECRCQANFVYVANEFDNTVVTYYLLRIPVQYYYNIYPATVSHNLCHIYSPPLFRSVRSWFRSLRYWFNSKVILSH